MSIWLPFSLSCCLTISQRPPPTFLSLRSAACLQPPPKRRKGLQAGPGENPSASPRRLTDMSDTDLRVVILPSFGSGSERSLGSGPLFCCQPGRVISVVAVRGRLIKAGWRWRGGWVSLSQAPSRQLTLPLSSLFPLGLLAANNILHLRSAADHPRKTHHLWPPPHSTNNNYR